MEVITPSVDIDALPLKFGKYKGRTPNQVAVIDPSYIVWMYKHVESSYLGAQHMCSKELAEGCEMDIRKDKAEGYFGMTYWNE